MPVIELTENRRQAAEWEREALALVRSGASDDAVRSYERHERVVSGDDAAALRQRLVADWWAANDPDGSLMIAHRRIDVADLNGRSHTLMRAAGVLGEEELRVVAQLRYDERSRKWSLYACDRNERWFLYNGINPVPDVGPLLAEIGDDPTRIVWG